MTNTKNLPEFVTQLNPVETFSFACHPGVGCFTECCRMLELALTPYDVLRLRTATGLSSEELLRDYIIIEQNPGEPFPRFYLTMVDDGRASCVFVDKSGCSVYEHRPSACRTYPLGRAVSRGPGDQLKEQYVLLKEHHCLGFQEAAEHTTVSYALDQGLEMYNRFNDAVISILQHQSIRNGLIPSLSQIDFFILALYNLDTFRQSLNVKGTDSPEDHTRPPTTMADEDLLLYGINLVRQRIFTTLPHSSQ